MAPLQVNATLTATGDEGLAPDWNRGGDAPAGQWAGAEAAYYHEEAQDLGEGDDQTRALVRYLILSHDSPALAVLDVGDLVTFTPTGGGQQTGKVARIVRAAPPAGDDWPPELATTRVELQDAAALDLG